MKIFSLDNVKNGNFKYLISIGKRQPMHIGHKRSLERILSLDALKLIYVIGSSNKGGDALFNPFINPLNLNQQIEQFKFVFPDANPIFISIDDITDMSKWGSSIVSKLEEINIKPCECVIHFIGKEEDRITAPCSFMIESGKKITLEKGRWLIEALEYYEFDIWFDNEAEVNLSISARNLRNIDLINISKEDKNLFAAYDYIVKIAKEARASDPERDKILDIPLTLGDLSKQRIRLET